MRWPDSMPGLLPTQSDSPRRPYVSPPARSPPGGHMPRRRDDRPTADTAWTLAAAARTEDGVITPTGRIPAT